jgi:hypothetical protein
MCHLYQIQLYQQLHGRQPSAVYLSSYTAKTHYYYHHYYIIAYLALLGHGKLSVEHLLG